LEQKGVPVEIAVVAAGAWKSMQELNALEQHLSKERPDVVIFFNGLNDLTSGPTSRSLDGNARRAADGSMTTDHAQDYSQRVDDYLFIMQRAAEFCRAAQAEMLVILQQRLAKAPSDN
jgi:hypothetical protein